MENLELLLAQALCHSNNSRGPCRYHINGAKAVLNALAGAGMVVVPREPTAEMINSADEPNNRLPISTDEIYGIWQAMVSVSEQHAQRSRAHG